MGQLEIAEPDHLLGLGAACCKQGGREKDAAEYLRHASLLLNAVQANDAAQKTMLTGNGLYVREMCQIRQAFGVIERITSAEKMRYMADSAELDRLRKVKWRFIVGWTGTPSRLRRPRVQTVREQHASHRFMRELNARTGNPSTLPELSILVR
ncbi:hypothetical protein GCM10027317_15530 [Massilia agri]